MTLRRSFPSVVMTAILLVTAVVGLGMPNWREAKLYLVDGYPTQTAALAVAAFVCWGVILLVVLATVIISMKSATEVQMVQRRWTRATLFVTAGIIVLGMGTLHHQTAGYKMCCGNQPEHVLEAQQLAQPPH